MTTIEILICFFFMASAIVALGYMTFWWIREFIDLLG